MRSLLIKLVPKAALPFAERNPYLTLRQLPSKQQVFGVAPWGGVALLGVVWMVQPFEWAAKQLSSSDE